MDEWFITGQTVDDLHLEMMEPLSHDSNYTVKILQTI